MTESNTSGLEPQRCIASLLDMTPAAVIISNLGSASFALIATEDRQRNFYMTGAMGLTSAVGFGVAAQTSEEVVVIDGDGSLTMSAGILMMIGEYNPSNLIIVVFDNGVFETTGGQESLSAGINFASLAQVCGLAAWEVESYTDFETSFREASEHDGASVLSCHIEATTPEDHPQLDYGHAYMKHRFKTALSEEKDR